MIFKVIGHHCLYLEPAASPGGSWMETHTPINVGQHKRGFGTTMKLSVFLLFFKNFLSKT